MGENLKYTLGKREILKWYLRKSFVIWSYLFDFIKNGEFYLVYVLIKALFVNKSNSRDLIVKTYFGKILLRRNTMDFKMANNTYERYNIKLFNKELANKDMVIDIGANNGLYSINSALKGVQTLAFEPIDDNFKALTKNVELNNLNGLIRTFNFALGDKNEKAKFNYNHFNTGAASKFKTRFETIEKDVEIKVFDELQLVKFSTIKNVQVKLDVEGMEVNVIEGMQEFIKSIPNVCFFIETKHVGVKSIKDALLNIANFEFEQIDPFNIYAKKIN